MSDEHEKSLHSKSTLSTIRAATDEKSAPDLRAAVINSISAPITTLSSRFSRLKLHDQQFIALETKDEEAAAVELGTKILQVTIVVLACVM